MQFAKMHGLGNDFMLIDAIAQQIDLDFLPIVALANRYAGVGFDQLLVLLPSKNADVFCRIFNSDGSEAKQCGNGMRCVAKYLKDKKKIIMDKVSIETISGIVTAKIDKNNIVVVNMGKVDISGWKPIKLKSKLDDKDQDNNKQFATNIFVVSLGNLHGILRVDNNADLEVNNLVEIIPQDKLYRDGINIGMMKIIDNNTISLQSYERGVGYTLACGSNACAAAVTAIVEFGVKSPVTVKLKLGSLKIEWDGLSVSMSGPATHVFDGNWLHVK